MTRPRDSSGPVGGSPGIDVSIAPGLGLPANGLRTSGGVSGLESVDEDLMAFHRSRQARVVSPIPAQVGVHLTSILQRQQHATPMRLGGLATSKPRSTVGDEAGVRRQKRRPSFDFFSEPISLSTRDSNPRRHKSGTDRAGTRWGRIAAFFEGTLQVEKPPEVGGGRRPADACSL